MSNRISERPIVVALFCLWLAHLLAYVWIVPPWQHYDEPTHFEYAALIRDLGRLPTLDEQIPTLRRAIADSMIAAGFFQQPDLPITAPDLDSADLSLGVNERGHPPLYYTLVAIGTYPFRFAPVDLQLRAARCVSVALAALLFGAAYALLRMLTGERWGLRCAALAAMVLQPSFVDTLSSVNSDVLANLVAVLMLLVAVALLRRPGWRWVLASVLVLLLTWNVKRVLLVYSLIVPLAWLLAAPRLWRRAAAITGSVTLLAGIVWLAVQPWPLADWRGSADMLTPPGGSGHIGARAFVLKGNAGNQALQQTIYPYRLLDLDEQQLTLGAWMRAESTTTAWSPALQIDEAVISRSVTLDPTWRLITVTAQLPSPQSRVSVLLNPPETNITVYADSLALVEGNGPLPDEREPDGAFEAGVLAPEAPRNMLRNAGAERRVPPVPAPLGRVSGGLLDENSFAQTLSTLFNWRWIAAVYPRQVWLLFVGSWGVFGWGQYAVSAGWFTPLALMVCVSVLGSLAVLLGRRDLLRDAPPWRVRAWWLCALAVAIGWGTALLRVHSQPFPGVMFWSFGRYTFVAMLPSLLFFVAGFRALFPAELRAQATAAQIGFMGVFALVALTVFGLR